jgi:threonine synthase
MSGVDRLLGFEEEETEMSAPTLVPHAPQDTVPQHPTLGRAVTGLSCRQCGAEHPLEASYFCELCFGPLEVVYDYDRLRELVTRQSIASGPHSIWRYADLLPATGPEHRVDIGAGWTPLREAPRLAAELGLRKLWLKLDLANPTNSFKDRVVSVALSVARRFGFEVAACASTGNLANSVAAHAAASGLESIVFIPAGLESGKIAASTVYGGTVLAIEGSYDDVNRVCAEAASSQPWGIVNVNLRPYYAEGSKTLGFEVAEQLGWRAPDALVAPVASGAMLTKVGKGLGELGALGLIESPHTRLFGAQAEGCSPVARAFASGSSDVAPVRPATIAKSLAIGDPGDGVYVLEATRSSGGAVTAVPEDKVAEGIRLLARTEGVFTEGAGGVTISVLESLVAAGTIAPDEETVALITGSGLKTIETLGAVGPTATVGASLEEVESALSERSVRS